MSIKCETCGATPQQKNLFRINEKGVPGVWRCEDHLEKHTPPPEVIDVVHALQGRKRQ